jgi:antitoxin VapB
LFADTHDIWHYAASQFREQPMDSAKVFMTGRSQAVRLPKAYRFETDEVLIERLPDGAVVLRAKPQGPLGDRLWALLDGLPDDPTFARPDQGVPEVRDWLDQPTPKPKRRSRTGRNAAAK